jgi:serine/threonine protein kinase
MIINLMQSAEYGAGGRVSTAGDVYSYGILLLELFTGKRPTDEMFVDGLDIRMFAEHGSYSEIADPVILFRDNDEQLTAKMEDCLNSVFRLGVACSDPVPNSRMNISEVAADLHSIRSRYLGA